MTREFWVFKNTCLFFMKKESWIVLILKYPADCWLFMFGLSLNTTINSCEFLKGCPASFTGLSTSFSAVSWAHSPLSVSFSLFLWSAKAHIATGTMHTAREDFHYDLLNSHYSLCPIIISFDLHKRSSPNTIVFIRVTFIF